MAPAVIVTAKDTVVAYVTDKSMTIYGKACDLSSYAEDLLRDKMGPARSLRLEEAFEHILTKATQSKYGVAVLALNARIYNGVLYIQAEVLRVGHMMKSKLNVVCTYIQTKAQNIPKPLTCDNFIYSFVQHAQVAIFHLKDGVLQLQVKSTEQLQSSRAKALQKLASAKPFVEAYLNKVNPTETLQSSKAKVLGTLALAKPTVEAYLSKLRDGSIVIMSKISESVDQIKENGTSARSKAVQEYTRVYNALREALEGLPLDSAFIDAATNKVQVLKSKIGDLPVYVRDGAVHATGQVEAGYVHVKATITEVRGSLRLSLVEAVISAKTRCQDAAQATMIKADGMKNTSKAAKEAGMHKILLAVDYSKEMASDHKVQAIAAGAAVGASAGGATGFAAGATAGTTCGLLFAPLTLGLSVPIGAVIGGSAGTGFGALAGTTLGAIGGSYASESCMEIKQGILKKVRLVSGTGGMDHETK